MEKVSSTQDQASRESRKETIADNYSTCREDIAEVAIADIQPCPIIPDYKTPTLSTQPIVVWTPESCFCIDGWHYIEQAKAAGQSTIRCYVYHIAEHSIIELAIRKAAIRVMPQGGKCSYAESVRNTHRLRRALESTSDDLAPFAHGGDRRSAAFADTKQKNIVTVLTSRLGKLPTTINKYQQHGNSLNDTVMEELVNTGAPKLFFEAIQTEKDIRIAALRAEEKDEADIVAEISSLVSARWKESQQPVPPTTKTPPSPQSTQARRPAAPIRHTQRETQQATQTPRDPQIDSNGDQDPPDSDPTPTGTEGLSADDPTPIDETAPAAELKRIGEALIEIADGQETPTPQQIESIRALNIELSRLLARIAPLSMPKGSGNGGTA